MYDVEEFAKLAGWLETAVGEALYQTVLAAPHGNVLEIGAYKGKSTYPLSCAARETGRMVISIDWHRGGPGIGETNTLAEYWCNFIGLSMGDVVIPVVAKIEDAIKVINTPIAVCFIDGDHSGEAPRRDFNLVAPLLVDGAFVMFHDFEINPDRFNVKDGIAAATDAGIVFERRVDSLWIGRKPGGKLQ